MSELGVRATSMPKVGIPRGARRGRLFRTAHAFTLCLLILLAGCARGPDLPLAGTPSDPPPLPRLKPAPPPGFLGGATTGAPQAAALTLAGPSSYQVAPGDTVFSIARRFGLPVRSLIDENALTPPFILSVGRRLTLPRARIHLVASGDTVYGISRRYRVDMAELMRLNRIAPPYRITTGQRLVLPDPPGQVATAPVPAAQPVATVAAVPPTSQAETGRPLPRRNPQRQVARAPSVQEARRPAATATQPRGPLPEPPARSGGKFLWPVKGRILSGYGPKGGGLHNDGLNIAAARGTPVLAAENGVVAYAGNELRGFGNLLLIKHSGGWVTAYAHIQDMQVRRGERVRRGQPIAAVGSSGNVASPQLHFEIRKGTRAIDPTQVLAPRVTAQAG